MSWIVDGGSDCKNDLDHHYGVKGKSPEVDKACEEEVGHKDANRYQNSDLETWTDHQDDW